MRPLFGPSTQPQDQQPSNLALHIARGLASLDVPPAQRPAPAMHPAIAAKLALLRDLERRRSQLGFINLGMMVLTALAGVIFILACSAAGHAIEVWLKAQGL